VRAEDSVDVGGAQRRQRGHETRQGAFADACDTTSDVRACVRACRDVGVCRVARRKTTSWSTWCALRPSAHAIDAHSRVRRSRRVTLARMSTRLRTYILACVYVLIVTCLHDTSLVDTCHRAECHSARVWQRRHAGRACSQTRGVRVDSVCACVCGVVVWSVCVCVSIVYVHACCAQ
jgi:hypothetical protein